MVCLEGDDRYAIDTGICFGLASSGGIYGRVGDATTELFRANGIGPVSKWVNDHLFFRIQREHLADYNQDRKRWRTEILQNGGEHRKKGRLWFQGNPMPNGVPSEFDEDMSFQFKDLTSQTPRSSTNTEYTYCLDDIDAVAAVLGTP